MHNVSELKQKLEEVEESSSFAGHTIFCEKRRDISDAAKSNDSKSNITDPGLLLSLGQNELALGNAKEAYKYCKRASDCAGEEKNIEVFIMANENIATLYTASGELENASGIYKLLYDFSKECNLQECLGTAAFGLGSIYAGQNQLEQAMRYYQEALSIRRNLLDRSGEVIVLINIGGAFRRNGDLDSAQSYWIEARQILIDIDDKNNLARLDEEINSL